MKNLTLLIVLLLNLTAFTQTPVYNSYPAAKAVIFLDFDGHYVTGTNWNIFGPIDCAPANLNAEQITEIFNRVAEDYRPFNINITTDSTKYNSAPVKQRMRVILTVSNEWYGSNAGGTAYVNSFTWGATPCFIFTKLLNYHVKNISEATSHEAGHTLGLRHQAVFDANCVKQSDYNTGAGSGAIGWAPIMGVGYYRNKTTWHRGPMPSGCTTDQNDLLIITNSTNGFGYRNDEASDFTNAKPLTITESKVFANSLITTSVDTDVFALNLSKLSNVQIKVAPYSVAEGDLGSNLDVEVKLYNQSRELLQTYNPYETLSASIDTLLRSGNYYVSVAGVGNAFASNYASLGSYSINGTVTEPEPLPLHKLLLKGTVQGERHNLAWEIEADEKLVHQSVEVLDGRGNFNSLASLPDHQRVYQYKPLQSGMVQYRLRVLFDNGRQYYSNTIALKHNNNGPQVVSNQIRNQQLLVQSSERYQYIISDATGRMVSRGQVTEGLSTLSTGCVAPGIYFVRFSNGSDSFVEKFTRH